MLGVVHRAGAGAVVVAAAIREPVVHARMEGVAALLGHRQVRARHPSAPVVAVQPDVLQQLPPLAAAATIINVRAPVASVAFAVAGDADGTGSTIAAVVVVVAAGAPADGGRADIGYPRCGLGIVGRINPLDDPPAATEARVVRFRVVCCHGENSLTRERLQHLDEETLL